MTEVKREQLILALMLGCVIAALAVVWAVISC